MRPWYRHHRHLLLIELHLRRWLHLRKHGPMLHLGSIHGGRNRLPRRCGSNLRRFRDVQRHCQHVSFERVCRPFSRHDFLQAFGLYSPSITARACSLERAHVRWHDLGYFGPAIRFCPGGAAYACATVPYALPCHPFFYESVLRATVTQGCMAGCNTLTRVSPGVSNASAQLLLHSTCLPAALSSWSRFMAFCFGAAAVALSNGTVALSNDTGTAGSATRGPAAAPLGAIATKARASRPRAVRRPLRPLALASSATACGAGARHGAADQAGGVVAGTANGRDPEPH